MNANDTHVPTLPPHLGGHLNKTHTDAGAFIYIGKQVPSYEQKTFLDIGCATGEMVRLAALAKYDAYGIDGDWTLPQFKRTYSSDTPPPGEGTYILHDFTQGPPMRVFDLFDTVSVIWCVEFLEHVEEKYLPNLEDLFKLGHIVVITAAPPGHTGHHHVNCRPEEYWKGVFAAWHFKYNADLTAGVRKESSMVKPFMKHTGMVFVR